MIDCVLLLETIAWWHQVTVHPDRSKINVFKNGICQGSRTFNPFGGHIEPISIAGDKLLWKNAQKNAKKNSTSDTINKKTPYRRPFWTMPVWWPSKVASLVTSRHQRNIVKKSREKLLTNNKVAPWYACTYITIPVAQKNADKEATKGQGLGSTRWKGCLCKDFETFVKDIIVYYL